MVSILRKSRPKQVKTDVCSTFCGITYCRLPSIRALAFRAEPNKSPEDLSQWTTTISSNDDPAVSPRDEVQVFRRVHFYEMPKQGQISLQKENEDSEREGVKMEQMERELEDVRRRLLWEREAELNTLKAEARRRKAELDHNLERKRLPRDYEDKMREDTEKAKDEDTRNKERWTVIQHYEDKKRKDAQRAKDEEIRIIEKIERDEREAKEEEQRIEKKIVYEDRAREEREWQEFLQMQRAEEEKEKVAHKAEKEKLESKMRKRLAPFGYTESQIDVMVNEEKTKQQARAPGRFGQLRRSRSSLHIVR